LDPAEHVFYAGSSDGKIVIAALNTERITTADNYGMHITGSFSNHRLSFSPRFPDLKHIDLLMSSNFFSSHLASSY
jgi:hypothetical protein